MAAEVLDELGFGDLGFYSLGVLYFSFAICCFFATPIVNRCGERFALVLGSLCYAPYIAGFILASGSIKYKDKDLVILSKGFIQGVMFVNAVINGFGAAILWVA